MNLESLVAELRGFVGITRKKQIGDLIEHFPVLSEKIIADFGEDAAVIDDGDDVLLFAADGIWSKLMEADPEWSGYCSVLVNVHDIAAMGGWPIAMVDVLSVSSPQIAEAVLARHEERHREVQRAHNRRPSPPGHALQRS